ncbi:hypothetical protein AVEN_227176-1 [Araneus ventricosus]|uniref:Uncharacterized protein n=1 Tax=Araneus ventricosus TaxID=182803 RepID=A0A4Y2BW16_ARAVE|nr:hypothetical protein AVEN_227176-1 [Araneus ventricosus]
MQDHDNLVIDFQFRNKRVIGSRHDSTKNCGLKDLSSPKICRVCEPGASKNHRGSNVPKHCGKISSHLIVVLRTKRCVASGPSRQVSCRGVPDGRKRSRQSHYVEESETLCVIVCRMRTRDPIHYPPSYEDAGRCGYFCIDIESLLRLLESCEVERDETQLCVVLLKNPLNFRNHFLLGYVPQHRTLKLQDTRQDREQHHETSTQTRMTERHHGKKMAPVAPPTIERRRQLIVTATELLW